MKKYSFLSNPIWRENSIRASPSRDMVLDFIASHARMLKQIQPKPQSLQEWSARSEELHSNLVHSLGLANLISHDPINPRSVGKIEREHYWVEKLIYDPHPGFPTAAHLYIPKGTEGQSPAILYVPGHWMENSKLETDIQVACANLARLGFIVLVYDPIGQGERLGSWRDHGHLEPLLVGISQAGMMVWESIRAIDLLVSRSDVDPKRIGMTGASGGGLNTVYTCAVDDRIRASVPVCFVTDFLSMMEAERNRNWEDGVDLCNQVPGIIAFSEMSDICGLFAPRPLCLVAGKRDWMFPIEGTREIYKEISRIYKYMGASDQVALVEVDQEHGYWQAMRQAAYGWFSYWLKESKNAEPVSEEACELIAVPFPAALTYMYPPNIEDLGTLRSRHNLPIKDEGLCFPAGYKPNTGSAITALTQKLAQQLSRDMKLPKNPEDWQAQRPVLIDEVNALLGIYKNTGRIKDWFFNQSQNGGIFFERVEFESEPGIRLPGIFLAPAVYDTYLPVVIYLDERGKESGLVNGFVEGILNAGMAVFAVDVRGIGETAVSDFEATTNAIMTDRPFFGQQVWDVLAAIDELWQRTFIGVQVDKGRIGCFGNETAGIIALYAAALDERLKATTICKSLVSYPSLIQEQPDHPASVFLFDVLNHFDLPHVISLVAPRSILVLNPIDGNRNYLSPGNGEEATKWPRQVYEVLSCIDNLVYECIGTNQSDMKKVIDFFKTHL